MTTVSTTTPVRSSLLTRDPLPKVKDAYNVVSREESYRGFPESYGVTESKQNATSFVAKTFHNNRREFNNNNNFTRGSTSNVNRGLNPNLNCKNYGKIRHTIDRCFEIVGFLTGFKSNNNNIGKQIFNANVDVKVSDKQASADQVLSVLHQDFDISKSSTIYVCEVCYRAKQTRDPFPLSSHKSKSLGELVHLDLWGPYRVPSREGFKYFLTIVDDYSRDIWVYLIKTTDEVIDVFVSFINFVNNQFDVKRKTIFYAHTPQQNGIAERKHRYLLNVAIFGFKSPNDDGRATPVEDGSESSFRHNGTDTTKSSLCQEENTATHFGDQSSSEGNLSQNYPGQSLSFNENNSKDGQTPGVRRSSRQTKLPVKLNDYMLNSNVKYGIEKFVNYSNLKGANLCFATTLNKSTEPYCLYDALSDTNWVDAMNNEIKALNRNNTWTECDLPHGRKPIGSKWIWKIKYKAFGKIERYKARLVANGFSQKDGFDYAETFSHVVKMVTVRYVYMTLPEGYNSESKSKVCKLNKSVFGLKQAPRLLRYLKDLPGLGIQFDKVFDLKLRVFSDADWAKYTKTRKSITGFCVSLGKSLVSWKSKKQATLSRSSTELEYRSMTSATCEAVWLANLLHTLRLSSMFLVDLHYDNSYAIQLVANPVFHEKSKHFEIDVHFVREKVAAGVNKTVKVHTDLQVADIFIKCLGI
ncbi:ribonuclease H-like domain-containing protein [Tanacetum coccineum]